MKKLILILTAFTFLQCSNIFGPENHEIRFALSGTAKDVKIIYAQNRDIRVELHADLPWSHKFEAKDGEWIYLRAIAEGNSSKITMVIYCDGKTLMFAKSTDASVDFFLTGEL